MSTMAENSFMSPGAAATIESSAGSRILAAFALIALATSVPGPAIADAITDWNVTANRILVEAAPSISPPPANRTMAIVQTAAYVAANSISRRYPQDPRMVSARRDASIDAAIAAAERATLTTLVPTQRAAIEAEYRRAIERIEPIMSRDAGIRVGEAAAAAVLAERANDGYDATETYRPQTRPGVYVPTAIPIVPQWATRRPWLLSKASALRPGPPPELTSERWARDQEEVRLLGARDHSRRSSDQTEAALFWQAALPSIYHGLVRCVSAMPGRDVTQNARLFAAVAQASDDTLIAVLEAKYHYAFWRPITAIRNGDVDGNDATAREPSWLPLIETPPHPEYPCAHCAVAGAVVTVLKAELGGSTMPPWSTTSYATGGQPRTWRSLDDFAHEVSEARILGGVHYRNSAEVGAALGVQVGDLAVQRWMN